MVFHLPLTRVRKILSIWKQVSRHKIPELRRSGVNIKNRLHVDQLIQALQTAGIHSLQVISDFDMTLSKFAHDGQRCATTHSLLQNSSLISEDCKSKMRVLQEKFYPVAIDTMIPLEEKVPLMVEWWSAAHELLVEQGIPRTLLAGAVSQSGAKLREGYGEFFARLQRLEVPVMIFSAGVGNILEEILKQKNIFSCNITIKANYMHFNKEGVLQGFREPLIHTFNKGHLSGPTHTTQDRPNVLLLGDSLGDISMADNLPNIKNILRVGFLNDKVERRRETYTSSYDIVLERDETLDIPNAILRYIAMETDS